MTDANSSQNCSPPLRRGSSRRAGFALLAVLLMMGVLALVVGLSLQHSEGSRGASAQAQQEIAALGMAEAGLEQSRAYINELLQRYPDLDRALDPREDTDCRPLAATPPTPLTDQVADDHRPLFTGGIPVRFPPPPATGGKLYTFMRLGEGGYLLRIDDNEDDALADALTASTNNTAITPAGARDCFEGPGRPNNPVRDRDQAVFVTSIGVFPVPNNTSTDAATLEGAIARARARRVLRVRVGPPMGAGVLIGGDFTVFGNSRICGDYGNVLATGNLYSEGGGSPDLCAGDCTPNTTCTAHAQGGTCNLTGNECLVVPSVPRPPPVHVWSSINAPPACPPSVGDNCIPFFYLRHVKSPRVTTPESVELYMWNYSRAGCEDPRAGPTIPTPKDTTTLGTLCWELVFDSYGAHAAGCTSDDKAIAFADSNLLRRRDPRTLAQGTASPLVRPLVFPDRGNTICPTDTRLPTTANIFKMTGGGDFPDSPNGTACDPKIPAPPTAPPSAAPQPDSTNNPELQRYKLNTTQFEYENPVKLPRGVWLIEGNVLFKTTMPACPPTSPADPGYDPGYGASLITTGSLEITRHMRFNPIHPRGFALLVGEDLRIDTGNTSFETCGDSGAVMVHEQLYMTGNSSLQAQVVVEDAASCSNSVTSSYIEGTAEISVTNPPPIYTEGGGANVVSWSDSSL